MDHQKRGRLLLIFVIGIAIIYLVVIFLVYFDGEKITHPVVYVVAINIVIAVILLLKQLRGKKEPPPPDPK